MRERSDTEIPRIQTTIAILWPSFLVAGIATIIFFTVVDPVDLACSGGSAISHLAAYSLGFFWFWLLTSSSCLLALYFNKPCPRINKSKS